MTLEDLKKQYPFVEDAESVQTKYVLDGNQMHTEGEMLAETYKKLQFDDFAKYANYDGLIELLSPVYLSELSELTIVIENINDMLTNSKQDDLKRFFGMLSIVNGAWEQKSAGSFRVIAR